MADFTTLLNEIKARIYDNTDGDITGQVLQDVLINIVETINSSLPSDSNEGTLTLLSHAAQLKTAEALNAFYGEGLQVGTAVEGTIPGMDMDDCFVISIGWPSGDAYAIQIAIDDSSPSMKMRYCKSGTWSSWVTVYPQSGSSGGSSIVLPTANRIVETDSNGNLIANSEWGVTTLVDALENWVLENRRDIIEIFTETDVLEFEFEEFADVIAGGPSHLISDAIILGDVPSDSQGLGEIVHILTDNVGIDYSYYNDKFAYRVARSGKVGDITAMYYEFYLYFSNDDKGNSYTDYQYNSDQTKLFKNKDDGKVYEWKSGKLVEYDKQISGNKLQLGSVREDKLNDNARAKLNIGSMLPFRGILTQTQRANITLYNYDYIQSVNDDSPMGVYYYQNEGYIGFFLAMSELSARDAADRINAPAYKHFINSEIFNDYSSGTIAREDQLFILQRTDSEIDGVTGEDRGVYRYNGITKSFIKLF